MLHVSVVWILMWHKVYEFLKIKVKEDFLKYLNALLLVLYSPVLMVC